MIATLKIELYINYIGLSTVLVNLNIFIANIIDSYYQMYISIKIQH